MANNLKERNGIWYVRKDWEGRTREQTLETSGIREATTLKNRFLSTLAETKSWDAAVEDLKGKKILRPGESPTLEDMEKLYREFLAQSAKPIKEKTIKLNIATLGRIMDKLGAKTIAAIDRRKLQFRDAQTGKELPGSANLSAQIRIASSIFKKTALAFYGDKGIRLENPFSGVEKKSEKRNRYKPLAASTRAAIWNEGRELEPIAALAVLMALEIGLRKNEIDKARVGWIGIDGDMAHFTVQEEEDFETKSYCLRTIPISKELAEEILAIRAKLEPEKDDQYILPGGGIGEYRHEYAYGSLNDWLREKGIKAKQPLHSLRKEFGSMVYTHHGIEVACEYLGHSSIALTYATYSGLTKKPTLDSHKLIFGKGNGEVESLKAENEELRQTVVELRETLASLRKVLAA